MSSSFQKKTVKVIPYANQSVSSQFVEQPLWHELKVQGRNIQRRSYHSCVIQDNKYAENDCRLYVYGGYDINTGILSDFHCARLDCEPVEWEQLKHEDQSGYPGKRYGHSVICYQQQMVLFGGKVSCLGNTNNLNFYSFAKRKWLNKKMKGEAPQIDSHSAVLWKDEMLVFGGFMGAKIGKYSNSIYSLNLKNLQWRELAVEGKLKPVPRANSSMAVHQGTLVMFGGGDLNSKFNDLWKFDPQKLSWERLQTKLDCIPETREGHSLTVFNNNLIIFGGIHDITHELNNVAVYRKGGWQMLQQQSTEQYLPSEQNEIALSMHYKKIEESQNLTEYKSKRLYRQLKELNYNSRPSDPHPQKQQKSKNDIRKHHLLKQFEMTPEEKEKFRNHSPTLESLKSSISAINSGNPFKKLATNESELIQLKKINQKRKPCARDGHSACIYGNSVVVFGGDRHMMSFNDMFVLDLEKLEEQLNKN